MHADPADQQHLITVADLDAELGRLQHSAKSLPQHARVSELMEERADVLDAFTAASTRVDDLQVAVERAESDLAPVRARLERESERVEDGSITDQKTLSGLLEEIERLRKRVSDLEDEELGVMGELEEEEETRDELETRKAEVETELRAVVAERDEEVAGLQTQAKQLQHQRRQTAEKIDSGLLKLYERIRSKKGYGAARLARGRCSGCQLEVTVVDLDRFRHAPANEVLRCAECDCILIRTPESGL